MREVRENITRLSNTTVPVLILGESGTGKDVIAHYIHDRSSRREGPFLKVNCSAIPGQLMESELFGYEQGAFTGAYRSKPGLLDRANGGTLFLDEIAEADLACQAKLLHLLQDGTFTRVGGGEELVADCRIICATSRDLDREVAGGTFRGDLFYRINVVSITMATLRARSGDIPALVDYFLDFYRKEYSCSVQPLSSAAMDQMLRHSWPGNIRQLENLIRRYVVLGTEESIIGELEQGSRTSVRRAIEADGTLSLKSLTRHALRDLERQIIVDVLQANNWNRKETARILKISYRGLFYKLKAVGVEPKAKASEERRAASQFQSSRKSTEI